MTDTMSDSIRLSKRVAEMRACSRREAEQIIVGGWVRVDGVVVEEPQFRVANQQIEIAPEANPAQAEPVTLLLHKPAGFLLQTLEGKPAAAALLSLDNLWAEDASGIHPLKMHFTQQTACAALEAEAGGLIVFSQDWRIVRKLTEDAATVEHEVVVEVAGDLAANRTPEGVKRLNRGSAFNGRTPTSLKVSWQNETRLRVALKGAQPGQIAALCIAAGLQVVSMKRIRLGGVAMGKLPAGQWRYLRTDERF
jgi:23S rRNA pseudouridine2604 synthase